MVDPIHRPQLIQSLCKVSYIKADLIQQLMKETGPSATLVAAAAKPQESPIKQEVSSPSSSVRSINVNLPDPKLFPFLSRRLAFNNSEDPDVSAAKAMLSLGQSHLMNNNRNELDSGMIFILSTW